jgi:hypothetical protein
MNLLPQNNEFIKETEVFNLYFCVYFQFLIFVSSFMVKVNLIVGFDYFIFFNFPFEHVFTASDKLLKFLYVIFLN